MSTSGTLLAHIEARSAIDPRAPLIVEADGDVYTYADSLCLVESWTGWLAGIAATRPLRVAALLPNIAVTHLLRVAAAEAGVVFTSLNPMLWGRSLLDALDRSRITDLVLPRVQDGQRGDADALLAGRRNEFVVHWSDGKDVEFEAGVDTAGPGRTPARRPARPCHTLVYTSGTSGPAKPVRLPAELLMTYGRLLFGDDARTWPDGGYYSPWHAAHVLGAVALEAAVQRGLALVLRRKFDITVFWDDVVEHACRLTVLISVANTVWAARASAPATSPLEIVGVSPGLGNYRAFEERFGVQIVNIYGMTELGTVLSSAPGSDRWVTGRPSRHYRCKIVPLADGSFGSGLSKSVKGARVGELAVRPVGVTSSYEPGSEPGGAWRDGWFHTGDLFVERDGDYRFVGRAKDTIRRHGRNISAQDLEDEVRVLPGVEDCACIGYTDLDPENPGIGDEEVRLFVVPGPSGGLDVPALITQLRERLPGYVLPRYVDVVGTLPRTSSGKLCRRTLREMPLSGETFDRKRDLDLVRRSPGDAVRPSTS